MLRSAQRAPRALRIIAVILAIAAMLCVSAASVSAAHTHLKEPVDQCTVCHSAHMTAPQVAVIQVIHALELQSVLSSPVAIDSLESCSVLSSLTRGPPVSL
jgi:hypothetical protein